MELSQKVSCILSGRRLFDKRIYEERLNQDAIEVKIAADAQCHHHRSSVEYLVAEFRELHPNGHFIGIRDKDTMTLFGQSCPSGIYATDHRDIEMTIFASPSFLASEVKLADHLEAVLPPCRYLAYIRIYAESKGLQKKVNDKMNIALVYD